MLQNIWLSLAPNAFAMAMSKLAEERLTIAVSAIVVAETALQWTVDYTRERKAFGQSIGEFQNTRFKLAELSAEILAKRVFVDRCIEMLLEKKLDAVDAAAAKMLCTELQCRTVDDCLQFFGGYGYMLEYPIARAYIDSRVRRIAGGSSEIMREIIGRRLFSEPKR
jgi:alkylation response protein AidB-like acyl-CoA dehydrogenase